MVIRISYRMIDHLRGSQLWHDLAAGKQPRQVEPAGAVSMIQKVQSAKPRRSDGSVGVDLTPAELVELKDYAEALQASTMGFSDRDILADYNAANGMLRRIHKVMADGNL